MWGFENQLDNVEQVLRDGNAEKFYRSIAIEQTDQRLQTDGNKPTAINQIGQHTSLQKVPQGQQLKLKWSTEKRYAVGFRAWLEMEKPEDPRSWGSHDELEALAKMYNVSFIVFESAQATGSQKIYIGEDDSPTIFLINTDNRHFDILVPQATTIIWLGHIGNNS
jgi:hypothetical protein